MAATALSHILTRAKTIEEEEYRIRPHVPFIAGPIDKVHMKEARGDDNTYWMLGDHTEEQDHHVVFKHRHESSTVELFYDLFFVANLATFSSNHEIINGTSFTSYLGFFTLLWATWFQTSLFDVRFATDSLFNRICKALHFMTMMGFALAGAAYSHESDVIKANLNCYQCLALVLMGSRLVLVFQYGVVLWYTRQFKATHTPLLITMVMLFVSAAAYLGSYFSLNDNNSKPYAIWYAFAAVEIAVVISTACIYRILSFKKTHLVERMGLLTLIIMGEGIIGVTKSTAKILQQAESFSARDAGVQIASVLLIYSIWVLYFDQLENDRFGTVRQQIWAALHYPAHLTILFTGEGAAQLIVYNQVIAYVKRAQGMFFSPIHFSSADAYLQNLTTIIQNFELNFKPGETSVPALSNFSLPLAQLNNLTATVPFSNAADSAYVNQSTVYVTEIFSSIENGLYGSYFGTEALSEDGGFFELFQTVFLFFYFGAGLLLFAFSALYVFGKTRKNAGEWASVGVRVFFGLCLIAPAIPIAVPNYSPIPLQNFEESAWHIPIVMMVFLLVTAVDNILTWRTNANVARRQSAVSDDSELAKPAHGGLGNIFGDVHVHGHGHGHGHGHAQSQNEPRKQEQHNQVEGKDHYKSPTTTTYPVSRSESDEDAQSGDVSPGAEAPTEHAR